MRTTITCKACGQEWESQAREKTTTRCGECRTPNYIPVGVGRPREPASSSSTRATTNTDRAPTSSSSTRARPSATPSPARAQPAQREADAPPRRYVEDGEHSDGRKSDYTSSALRERDALLRQFGGTGGTPASAASSPPTGPRQPVTSSQPVASSRPAVEAASSRSATPSPNRATRSAPSTREASNVQQGAECLAPGCGRRADDWVTWEGDSPHPMLPWQGAYCRGDRTRLTTRSDVQVVRLADRP